MWVTGEFLNKKGSIPNWERIKSAVMVVSGHMSDMTDGRARCGEGCTRERALYGGGCTMGEQ